MTSDDDAADDEDVVEGFTAASCASISLKVTFDDGGGVEAAAPSAPACGKAPHLTARACRLVSVTARPDDDGDGDGALATVRGPLCGAAACLYDDDGDSDDDDDDDAAAEASAAPTAPVTSRNDTPAICCVRVYAGVSRREREC